MIHTKRGRICRLWYSKYYNEIYIHIMVINLRIHWCMWVSPVTHIAARESMHIDQISRKPHEIGEKVSQSYCVRTCSLMFPCRCLCNRYNHQLAWYICYNRHHILYDTLLLTCLLSYRSFLVVTNNKLCYHLVENRFSLLWLLHARGSELSGMVQISTVLLD